MPDFQNKSAEAPKKWYQKNSPLTIVILLAAFAFLAFAVYSFVAR